MTVCAHRTDTPGFFTSCVSAVGSCRCAADVRQPTPAAAPALAYVPWTCHRCGSTGRARPDFDVRCTCGAVTRSSTAHLDTQETP